MATKIVFIPKQPDAILDIAKSLTPPGFELVVVDQDTPEFYDLARDPRADKHMECSRQRSQSLVRGRDLVSRATENVG